MKKIGVILFGIIFITIGIFLMVKDNKDVKKCTEEIVGTVVEIKEEESIEDDDGFTRTEYTYYPIIEYKVGDKTVKKQGTTGSNPSKYKVNDKIDILYNPDNVEEFIIKGDNSSKIISIVFVIAGAIVAVSGFVGKF